MNAGALLRLHPGDPVAIVTRDLPAGAHVHELTIVDAVARGHKVALADLPAGALAHKYGHPIGVTTAPIRAGAHVHTHNLASLAARRPTGLTPPTDPAPRPAPATPPPGPGTFLGLPRPDGRVGTRNYVAVMSSVNCSATVVRRIAGAFHAPGALDDHPGVDGVMALAHAGGCGLAADGEGLALLRRTLAGYARHPNVVGVVLVGLGCEVNQIAELEAAVAPVFSFTIQGTGGTRAAIDEGVARVRDVLTSLALPARRPVPPSELVLGLNCGGSDAWSGITANPVLGVASDMLVAAGGTAILGETPEIHGAEGLLAARAVSAGVRERLLSRVAWWQDYTARDGATLDGNPSPGNRAGGITTIEEKSLGAVAKAGASPLADVVAYAEPVRTRGLVFMDTPGYDPVSVTGIVAGGATLVCFTTGRGSVLGSKPAPTLKLATTTELFARMSGDMDVNCGAVLDGEASVGELGAQLWQRILDVASGQRTASEELGAGDEEFVPWQLGAVL